MGTKVLKEKASSGSMPSLLLRQSSSSNSRLGASKVETPEAVNSQSQDIFRSKFGFGSIMSSKTPSEFMKAPSESSKSSSDAMSRGLGSGCNFAFKTLSP